MWNTLLSLESNTLVKARIPEASGEVSPDLSDFGIDKALLELGAESFKIYPDEVARFIEKAKASSTSAFQGITIAEKLDAQAKVVLSNNDMLASMEITGAFGGKGLDAPVVLGILSEARITKGINKKALRKILQVSAQLPAGETFTQPFAVGIKPENGKDTQFVPHIEDISLRVLAPQTTDSKTGKMDMRNLGETITVEKGDPLITRMPSTKGIPGYTVTGKMIPATPGKDAMFKLVNGVALSEKDPNVLIAMLSGLPKLKGNTVEIEDALTLKGVNVGTGHVKFKGSVIINGDVEPGMIVRATGDIAIGGFVESANIQAQGNISIAKGIIGHSDKDEQELSCVVKAKGNISSLYSQYAELQAGGDIQLNMHCMHSKVTCNGNLTVLDPNGTRGVLSGGHAYCSGKVVCYELGIEGDAATYVQAFHKYNQFKERLNEAKNAYKVAQEGTMEAVRAELELKKLPKEDRTDEAVAKVQQLRESTANELEKRKTFKERCEADLLVRLGNSTIEAKHHVFTHVSIIYGDELVTTKREHGHSIFTFNQYEIKRNTIIDGVLTEEKTV